MLRRTTGSTFALLDRGAIALTVCWLLVGCFGSSDSDDHEPEASGGSSRGGSGQAGEATSSRGGSNQGGGGSNQGGGGSNQGGGGSNQGGGGSSQGGTTQGIAGSPPCPPAPTPFTNPEGCPEQQAIYSGPQGTCELDSSVVCNLYVSTQNACPVATLPVAFACCQGNWQGAPCFDGAGGGGGAAP